MERVLEPAPELVVAGSAEALGSAGSSAGAASGSLVPSDWFALGYSMLTTGIANFLLHIQLRRGIDTGTRTMTSRVLLNDQFGRGTRAAISASLL